MKEVNFETYTKNPETGESGWDIYFVSVIADSKVEAKEILKEWDLFDEIILFNYCSDLPNSGVVIDHKGEETKVSHGQIWSFRNDQFSDGYKLVKN